MKSRDEILDRFSELRGKTLRKRKSELLARNFENCTHNVRLRVKDVGKVGLCQSPVLLGKKRHPLVCNDNAFSGRCGCFECIYTDESIERDFDEILSSPSRCGEEYPKLAMLIWFLQEDRHLVSSGRRFLGHIFKAFSELYKAITFQ